MNRSPQHKGRLCVTDIYIMFKALKLARIARLFTSFYFSVGVQLILVLWVRKDLKRLVLGFGTMLAWAFKLQVELVTSWLLIKKRKPSLSVQVTFFLINQTQSKLATYGRFDKIRFLPGSHTNLVFPHFGKQPPPVTDTISASWVCPVKGASSVL